MGNHDGRERARSALTWAGGTVQPLAKKWVTTVDAGPVSLVFLDSLLAIECCSRTTRKSAASLACQLSGRECRVTTSVVFVHHWTRILESDNALVDGEALFENSSASPHRKGFVFSATPMNIGATSRMGYI